MHVLSVFTYRTRANLSKSRQQGVAKLGTPYVRLSSSNLEIAFSEFQATLKQSVRTIEPRV